ncbi:MAG: 1-phosphofructokinase family hexose kinase [Planctomycetes bacterium]|nr:1-phosphofructokinase family hexose kinase [Planctomycetota bacterium]
MAEMPLIVAVALNPALDRILHVPDLAVGGHVRGRLVSVQPAGKAVNVARLLGHLGVPCILTGLVGEDDRDRFVKSFAKTPVRVEMFEVRAPTRENITLIDPGRGGLETHIRDVGFTVTEEDLERLTKKLSILAVKGAYVIVAGSLPGGVAADTFADILAVCRAKGAFVAVDSSGPGLAALRKARDLWLIKPNRQELAELAGKPAETEADIRAAVKPLLRRIDNVVVTLGAEGAYLFCREGAWRAAPHVEHQEVVKTVGSGDALMAGFVSCHASRKRPPECLRYGVACGTAATFQTRAGDVNPYDVKACLEKAELAAVK